MDRFVIFLNGLLICIYCTIIATAMSLEIFKGEVPCPLCYLQRVAMISISIAALANLYYGVKTEHYGMIIFGGLVGGAVAFRQIALHICPEFPKFGIPFWGISLYTWSFLTFVASILLVAVLLCLYRSSQGARPEKWNAFTKFAAGYLFLIICGNILSVFIHCGLGMCE